MSNEVALKDSNVVPTMLGVGVTSGEIRKVHTDENGILLTGGSGGGTISPNATVSGVLNTPNQILQLSVPSGHSGFSIKISGTFSSTSTLVFESSVDGVLWLGSNGRLARDVNNNDQSALINDQTVGGPYPGGNPSHWRGNIAGYNFLRVRLSVYNGTDSINVTITTTEGTGATFMSSVVPISALSKMAQVNVVTVGTATIQVDTGQADRKSVEIHMRSNSPNNSHVYVGFANTVSSTAFSREMAPGESVVYDVSEAIPIYCCGSTAGCIISVTELS